MGEEGVRVESRGEIRWRSSSILRVMVYMDLPRES